MVFAMSITHTATFKHVCVHVSHTHAHTQVEGPVEASNLRMDDIREHVRHEVDTALDRIFADNGVDMSLLSSEPQEVCLWECMCGSVCLLLTSMCLSVGEHHIRSLRARVCVCMCVWCCMSCFGCAMSRYMLTVSCTVEHMRESV